MKMNKKSISLVWLLATTATLGNYATAHDSATGDEHIDVSGITLTSATCHEVLPAKFLDCEASAEAITALDAPAPRTASATPKSATRAITSVTDLEGYYVMTWEALLSGSYDSGIGVRIAAIEGTDSVYIYDFWELETAVKACVNITEMTISIPNQTLGTDTSYGEYDLAYCDESYIYRSREIEGTIGTDGTITITSSWGAFVSSGDYKNLTFGAYKNTAIEPANARITRKQYDPDDATYTDFIYGVVVEQLGSNLLSVKNLANYGNAVEIVLKRDSTATIDSQVALTNYYGDWCTYAATWTADMSSISDVTYIIYCNQASDARTISWSDWTVVLYGYKLFLGYWTDTKLEVDFDITYPVATVTSLTGGGTESDPYLISNLDELVFLADEVNDATSTSAFAGQYFSLQNDINMTGYRFTPIGYGGNSFAGTFAGNSHTLTGLSVSTGYSGCAGLFGLCDSTSTVKDLTLAQPTVNTNGSLAGCIAAQSLGTIDNCHVTAGTLYSKVETGAGGIAAEANIITNCSVTSTQITCLAGAVGGVAGTVTGKASYCSATNVDMTVNNGTYYNTPQPAGGVVGTLQQCSIDHSCFTGSIYQINEEDEELPMYIGGVVGYSYCGTISQCFNAGSLLNGFSNHAAIGGIAGYLYGGSITDCYNTGYATYYYANGSAPGGIAGYIRPYDGTECIVSNCYVASPVESEYIYYGELYSSASPTFTNVYYDRQLVDVSLATDGLYTSDMTSSSGLQGLESSIWTFTEGYYPRLTDLASTEASNLSASALIMDKTCYLDKLLTTATINLLGSTTATTTGQYSTVAGDSLALTSFGTDTLYFTNSTAGERFYIFLATPLSLDGSGTEDDPYLVKSKSDLLELSTATTTAGQLFVDTYFKMTNDIDMENDDSFEGISSVASNSAIRFYGHFDGGGYTIHNMKIAAGVVWTIEPTGLSTSKGTPNSSQSTGYRGFIGRLAADGSLKNLTMASDCDFTNFWTHSAPLVAYNFGTVDNCRNYADVVAYSTVTGGIVGYNASTGTVSNCYNDGSVKSGYTTVGGIAGLTAGLIQNCQNNGDVAAEYLSNYQADSDEFNYAGGITGSLSGGRIENCINAGTVTGYSRIAGIFGAASSSSSSGYSSDAISCLNYGTVLPVNETYVGAIGGNSSVGTFTGNYYDGQISFLKALANSTADGATAATTAEMTAGTALDGLSTDLWTFTAGSYPVLTQFASESKAAVARTIIATLADGETVGNVISSITLSTDNNCSWTLQNGSLYKIENGSLIVPSDLTDVATDTLIATAGTVTKPIFIQTTVGITLSGSGTQESPYLINSTDDWLYLANYIADNYDPLTGKFVKITADLDFSDTTMIPLSFNRTTYFDGDLDGNGMTIKGFDLTSDASTFGPVAVYTDENSCIHDLTVEGTLTSTTYTYLAGVVGCCAGTLKNITCRTYLTSSKNYTAGLVGVAKTGARLIDCVFEGTLNSSGTYTSGLVAYSSSGVYYERCGNRGTVNYTGSTSSAYVSGLLGYCFPDTLIGCFNEGSINVTNSTSSGHVAGIISYAYAQNKSGLTFYLKDCYNAANLTAAYNVGGIIANANGYAYFCLDGCYNTGNITATYTSTKTSSYTGGIATGYSPASTYTGCYNTGEITSCGTTYTGGLFGYYRGSFTSSTPTTISGCYNTGRVSAAGNYAGGISACLYSYLTISRCYNIGAVEGTTGVGGIVGYVKSATSSIISDCYNMGAISGSDYTGGIAGQPTSSTSISTVYSAASVACSGDNYGNLVGSEASVSTGYYLSPLDCNGVEAGSGLSYSALAQLSLSGWTAGDDYTYPRLDDSDYAKAYAATVIPSDGDTRDSVTGTFFVGTPDGVAWTASPDAVALSGNTATFTASVQGTLTMTATCGDVSVDTPITCNVEVDGIAGINAGCRTAVEEVFYTPAGQRVAAPAGGKDKAIYIVVTTYDDGSTSATIEAR